MHSLCINHFNMKNKYFTLWLSSICITVFILQSIIPGFTDLFILNSKAINSFQIWRFFSAIFLHGSIMHLLFNLVALFLFGLLLEGKIGSKRFLVVFLVTGIFVNIFTVNFYDSSLGASGAIMGIIGCLTIIEPFMMVWAFGFILPMFIAAIVWIIGDLIGVFFPSDVANFAHLSGIAVGFIFGAFFRMLVIKRSKKISKMQISDNYIREWENVYMK